MDAFQSLGLDLPTLDKQAMLDLTSVLSAGFAGADGVGRGLQQATGIGAPIPNLYDASRLMFMGNGAAASVPSCCPLPGTCPGCQHLRRPLKPRVSSSKASNFVTSLHQASRDGFSHLSLSKSEIVRYKGKQLLGGSLLYFLTEAMV